jgi:diguanylate cyclase (GGDEF)-like protein
MVLSAEEQMSLFKSAADKMDVGVAIIDVEGRIWFWNQWLGTRSGVLASQACGQPFFELFPDLNGSTLALAIEGALKRGQESVLSQSDHEPSMPLFEDPAAPAERLHQVIHVLPLAAETRAAFCLLQVNDISRATRKERALHEHAEELRRLTCSDPLTGVANRRMLDDVLAREFGRARRTGAPLSVIMVDVDNFRQFNELYGRPAGDFCLQRLVNAIKGHLRRPADFVGRHGGEEFAILLPDTPSNEAFNLAQQLRTHIESLDIPHEGSELAKRVTVSMGVTALMANSDISSAIGLLNRAEIALDQAKKFGRNRVNLFQEPVPVS